MREIKAGDKFRVKSTPILRQYGIRCGSDDPYNCKVWPKEIGTVRVYQGNGWKGMELVFKNSRTIQIGTLYSDSDTWEIDMDVMANFKTV